MGSLNRRPGPRDVDGVSCNLVELSLDVPAGTASDGDGNIPADAVWTDQIMTDITFNHGFRPADFAAPAK